MKSDGLSVIVCCYNSSGRIRLTLEHLSTQQVDAFLNWEIIIIDNNSKDDTANTAEKFLSEKVGSPSWKIVFEPNPGLSNARNKGFEEAKYNIVLMVDDDNSLAPNYVQGIWDTFKDNPHAGMVGGLGIAALESAAPKWFEKFDYCYAVGPQTEKGLEVEHLYGAGLALRMDVLENIRQAGFKSLLSDRTGSNLMSGGDTELCLAYRMAGFKLIAVNELTFKHHLPAERVNWKYLRRLFFGFGQTKARLDIYSSIMAERPIRPKGKFPAWFDRVYYLAKNLINDLPILAASMLLKMEGNGKLLSAIGKLGQIRGIIDLRQEYDQLYMQVQSFKDQLENDR